jgi:hypothetical protein
MNLHERLEALMGEYVSPCCRTSFSEGAFHSWRCHACDAGFGEPVPRATLRLMDVIDVGHRAFRGKVLRIRAIAVDPEVGIATITAGVDA